MKRLIAFEQISVDGYFADTNGDMSWAHKHDAEWNEFVANNASGGGVLVFGRITFDMMASFWPTELGMKTAPTVAKQMTALPKVVFSRTLKRVEWANTEIVRSDLPGAIRELKRTADRDLVVMGSGTIVQQLTDERLVDEYQLVVNPIALGSGRGLFAGIRERVALRRTKSRTFANGNVLLCYEPA
jgi:dihydrofolate reductase